jgi:hypothetical protein
MKTSISKNHFLCPKIKIQFHQALKIIEDLSVHATTEWKKFCGFFFSLFPFASLALSTVPRKFPTKITVLLNNAIMLSDSNPQCIRRAQ